MNAERPLRHGDDVLSRACGGPVGDGAHEDHLRPLQFIRKVPRRHESLTAWGELDVEVLKEGVDKAEKEIKKLPKDLKELSKYKAEL